MFSRRTDCETDMDPPGYHALSAATTVDEIVRVTREYLRRTRRELADVPDDCRPRRLRGPRDIERWADRLDQASRNQRPLSDEQTGVDRLASHFLIASLRMRQLGASPA